MKFNSTALRRTLLGAALIFLVSLLLLILELLAIRQGWLPARVFAPSLLVLGTAFSLLSMGRILVPTLKYTSSHRQQQLEETFLKVTRGEYRALPDEQLLFRWRGWWGRDRQLTPEGEAALERARTRLEEGTR